jgi:hypothetical protein
MKSIACTLALVLLPVLAHAQGQGNVVFKAAAVDQAHDTSGCYVVHVDAAIYLEGHPYGTPPWGSSFTACMTLAPTSGLKNSAGGRCPPRL